MPLYKFLHSEHLPDLLSGKILVRPLRFYQLLETVFRDEWIGDENEGLAINRVRDVDFAADDDPARRERLRSIGWHISGPSRVVGGLHLAFSDAFVFSLSQGEIQPLTAAFCSGAAPYTACVEIADLSAFARCAWCDGIVDDGVRVKDLFAEPVAGEIRYGPNAAYLDDEAPLASDPFRKAPRYASQSEVRVVFQPTNVVGDEDQLIFSPSLPELMSVAFDRGPARDTAQRPRLAECALSDDDLRARLKNDLHELREAQRRMQASDRELCDLFRAKRHQMAAAYFVLRTRGRRDAALDRAFVGPVNGGRLTGILNQLGDYLFRR